MKEEEGTGWLIHEVTKYDTIEAIALKYNVPVRLNQGENEVEEMRKREKEKKSDESGGKEDGEKANADLTWCS